MTTSPITNDTPQSTPKRGIHISSRTLALLSVAFGLIVSGYLSYIKLLNLPMACVQGGAFNCDAVQASAYGYFPPGSNIAVAWLGFAMYIVIGALLLLENRNDFLREYSRTLTFGITLFGWLFSMWLVYAQVVLIGALCMWCLMHEANMTLLLPIIIYRLWAYFRPSTATA